MTIFDKALDTFKAIYGPNSQPGYHPYYNASHTPFKGMDVGLVKTLVNETEVNKYLKAWKKDNQTQGAFSHEYRDQFQFVTYSRKKLVLLPYEDLGNMTQYCLYDVLTFEDVYRSYYQFNYQNTSPQPEDFIKYRLPEPGEANKLFNLFQFKSSAIKATVQTHTLNPNLDLKYVLNDEAINIHAIIEYHHEKRHAYVQVGNKFPYQKVKIPIGLIHDHR